MNMPPWIKDFSGVILFAALAVVAIVIDERSRAHSESVKTGQIGRSAVGIECVTRAFQAFNSQKSKIMEEMQAAKVPLATIEQTIALRRMEEGYCNAVVQCSGYIDTIRTSVEFSRCIEEETREKYECDPSK